MTDRHSGYIVTLAEDLREDDAEHIINAIRMVRGVLSVEPVKHGSEMVIASARARDDIRNKLLSLLREL